ncbi:MAG: hypothetical protein U0794_18345 [Isosphaeraceae bacterium]
MNDPCEQSADLEELLIQPSHGTQAHRPDQALDPNGQQFGREVACRDILSARLEGLSCGGVVRPRDEGQNRPARMRWARTDRAAVMADILAGWATSEDDQVWLRRFNLLQRRDLLVTRIQFAANQGQGRSNRWDVGEIAYE